jgi:uncharacterized protein (TIGR03000 family)
MLKTLWYAGLVSVVGLTLFLIPGTTDAQLMRGGWRGGYSGGYSNSGYPVYGDQAYVSNAQYGAYAGSMQSGLTNPNDAGFILRLPDANAEVWFQDHKTQQQGFVRQYESDRTLDPGKTYTFVVRARWMQGGQQMDQTRQVNAQAGQNLGVDFTGAGYVVLSGPRPNTQYSFYPDTTQLSNPNDAGFIVRVPDANAEVWFQDHKTQQGGTVRRYESDNLDPNQTYTFHIRARWMQNGQQMDQTRDVQARAGQNMTVDFTNQASEQVPLNQQNQQQLPAPSQRTPTNTPNQQQTIPNTPNQQTPANPRIPQAPTPPSPQTPTNAPR